MKRAVVLLVGLGLAVLARAQTTNPPPAQAEARYQAGLLKQSQAEMASREEDARRLYREAILEYDAALALHPGHCQAQLYGATGLTQLALLTSDQAERTRQLLDANQRYAAAADCPGADLAVFEQWAILLRIHLYNALADPAQKVAALQEVVRVCERGLRATTVPTPRAQLQRHLGSALMWSAAWVAEPAQQRALLEAAIENLRAANQVLTARQALYENSDLGRALLSLGRLASDPARLREAAAEFAAALQANPNQYDTCYNLAATYALLGDTAQAMKHLALVIDHDPDGTYSRQAATDPDLASVRGSPAYADALDRRRRRVAEAKAKELVDRALEAQRAAEIIRDPAPATAAYQIEGAARADGKGASVWDMFCRKDKAIWNGQNGEVACDHYHRWREDVGLMRQLGLTAYRFSVAWARVLPVGTGRVNPKGLAFYDRLVDELLAAGITPFVTLFHWDYPYALYCRGGWLNPDSPRWFADYATVIGRQLGDRVKHWMTLNEPSVFVGLGHDNGIHAPGDKLPFAEVLRVTHHVLLAHGRAVRALRAASPGRCQIGFAPAPAAKYPATDRPADVRAARQAMFRVKDLNVWNNTWWMDPIFLGKYPADALKLFAPHLPPIGAGDLKTISAPVDFFGLNLYQGEKIRAGKNGQPETVPLPDGHPLTVFHWYVTPDALYWATRFFYERYQLPVYITENGMSGSDWIAQDGKVHDPQRIEFTGQYLRAFARAGADGVPIRGYFHWSFLDNFEWAEGYKQRFGLVHVDYPTGRRTPKDSAWWYADVARSNGAVLGRP